MRFALSLLVLVASIAALALSVPTKGLSLLALPVLVSVPVWMQSKRATTCAIILFYCVSYILFGLLGLSGLLIVAGATVILIWTLNRPLGITLLVVSVFCTLLYYEPCGSTEAPHRAQELSYLKQICLAVTVYRDKSGTYPDRLSKLQEYVSSPQVFAAPRTAGEREWFKIGVFQIWARKYDPGPVRQYSNWSEVDDGDCLYGKPSENSSSNTVMAMTRPGLMKGNFVSVGYLDGHVQGMLEGMWKTNADVVSFLGDLGLTNYLSLTTGD